jgi:hypothetical protein
MGIFTCKTRSFLNKKNIAVILFITACAIIFSRNHSLKWALLSLALFSTMSNDSIQTLGTFLASNRETKWWRLGIYISFLFIATVVIGWYNYYHQVHFDRLNTIPYVEHTTIFHILGPIVLLSLTCYGIPISTTFLILSIFANNETIGFMLAKTFLGYVVAFGFSVFQWYFLEKYFKPVLSGDEKGNDLTRWKILKWFATGLLWVSWLIQNTANFAVYIPRKLSIYDLLLFLTLGVITVMFIFYNRGGHMQKIVDEKQDIMNIRSATLVDLSFAFIILIFKQVNSIPMATTWVFIGLLGGREFMLAWIRRDKEDKRYKNALHIIFKDLTLATIGILISLILVGLSKIF